MVDGISVVDFINGSMSIAFLIGFASGLGLSAVVMMIRAISAIFKHIVKG